MPLFAVLDREDIVQVGDKTRLDASKSFATKGVTAISTLTIKPGDDQSAISVYDSDSSARYLDWVFTDAKFDVNSLANKIYFKVGATEYTGTVSSSSYTMSGLATAIQTAMNAAGSSVTFTVAYDDQTKRFTFTGTGSFVLQGFKTGAEVLPYIGVTEDTDSAAEVESEVAEYGLKTITVEAGNGAITGSQTFFIKVITEANDMLFSTDTELVAEEADIMKWVTDGRATFKNVHRQSQRRIIDWLNQQGYTDDDNEPLKKENLVFREDVHMWSKYMTLSSIFFGIHNAEDDVFKDKAKHYAGLATAARDRAVIQLDLSGDKKVDREDSPSSWSGTVLRR